MTNRGPRQLRETANTLLDAFIRAVEQADAGGKLSLADLTRVADALKASPELEPIYERAYAEIASGVLQESQAAQRVEVFHRLMTHPLDPLLDAGELSRDALPNFFNFLRLVLGEEVDALQHECVEVHAALKAKFGEAFAWDMFYTDDRAKLIFYRVLARIAVTFKRFEPRRDWFISVMQYTPATIGVAHNVFVPNKGRESYVFGEAEFKRMFRHLFEPVKKMSEADRALFERALDTSPDAAFAQFFRELG
jgi:hypothetical protein